MLHFDEELEAYVLELEDVILCWEEEPEDDCEEIAEAVREAYNRNIRHIAGCIFEEVRDIFDVKDIDEVIAKLGRPQIDPDNGQVTYCESSFDPEHIISFEYLDDDFNDIQYVSVDG